MPSTSSSAVTQLTVIIPAHNAGAHLAHSLRAIQQGRHIPHEIIVVDDGSTDTTRAIAQSFGATVLVTPERCGPAFARNMAASYATGEVLFFLDADVCVHADTVSRVIAHFNQNPELDAVIGSYDYEPTCKDFLSQYRNLMHAYVHQTGSQQASTFWSGCGAIRRSVLLHHGGFNETYRRPAVEDIELGYRLKRDNRSILLDHSMLVTHLKRWTFWSMVKTDIVDRGIPWTELILRDHRMPDDLNLQLGQRVSVVLAFLLVAMSGVFAVLHGRLLPVSVFAALGLTLTALLAAINARFYRVLAGKRGWAFMLASTPLHLLYHLYCGLSFLAGATLFYLRTLFVSSAAQPEATNPNAPARTGQESTP